MLRIKRRLIKFLEHFELYFKLKYSYPIYSILEKRHPKLQRIINAETSLYKSVLKQMPKNGLIFDIGANLGETLAIFHELGGTVVAVEPDVVNLRCLRARHANKQKVTIIPNAVSNFSGQETMYLQDYGDALHTISEKWKDYLESSENDRWKDKLVFSKKRTVQTTTLEELMKRFGTPFYIKIDVEGYEEKVLKGLKTKVPLLSFEANLPQFLKETVRCIEHLHKLNNTARFNYSNYDKLLLPRFVSKDEIIRIIRTTKFRCIDIFCEA